MCSAGGTTEDEQQVAAELSQQFSRGKADVLLVDDLVTDGKNDSESVDHFACERQNRAEPARYDDLVVLTSDSSVESRKVRLEDAESMQIDLVGRRPIMRLAPQRVSKPPEGAGERLTSALEQKYVSVWNGDSRSAVTVRDVLDPIAVDGYDIWLTGGTVRDAVRTAGQQAATGAPGDLDFVGSVPPGTFCERLREFVGRAEVPKRFNPHSGVVAVWTDRQRKERLLEYAALRDLDLTDGAYRFGCDLEADAQWRDLTINTLSFDWQREFLLDPTGRGIADVRALRLRPPGEESLKPRFRAEKLFRYLKFADRWSEADTDELRIFLCSHFEEIGKDMEMSEVDEIDRWADGLGPDAAHRRKRTVELLEAITPERKWDDLFPRAWGEPG